LQSGHVWVTRIGILSQLIEFSTDHMLVIGRVLAVRIALSAG
jgi:hypothetical protein